MSVAKEFTPVCIWKFSGGMQSIAIKTCEKSIKVNWKARKHEIARSRIRSLVRCLRFFRDDDQFNHMRITGQFPLVW